MKDKDGISIVEEIKQEWRGKGILTTVAECTLKGEQRHDIKVYKLNIRDQV